MGLLGTIGGFFRLGSSATPDDRKELLGDGKPETRKYAPSLNTGYFRRPRDLPLMTWLTIEQMMMDPTIRLGLAMRAAPLMNAEFAYKEKDADEWTTGIRAASPVVAEYVHRQLKRIWRDLEALLQAQKNGWAASEVMYHLTDQGTVEISRLLPRDSRDTRALVCDGEIVGTRFLRLRGHASQGHIDLRFPKTIFHCHKPQPGRYYGTSILEGAYSPWYDAWGPSGGLDSRRLTMMQNAVNGRRLYFPEGETPLTDSSGNVTQVSNRDVARQSVEQMLSGAVAVFSSKSDDKGNREWELVESTAMSGLQHLLQYPKDLDVEKLRGMEIPDDVLSADNSGAWEGKKVPMMAFFGGLDNWLGGLVRDVKLQVMDHLVELNFGKQWYEIETKPLAQQAMEQAETMEKKQDGGGFQPAMPPRMPGEGSEQGGMPQTPQRMSLNTDLAAAVGQGVIDAAKIVGAANDVIRMSLDQIRAPKGGVTIKGTTYPGGEWIPKEVAATLSESDKQKIKSGVYGSQQGKAAKQIRQRAAGPRVPAKSLSDKAARAKASHKLVDKEIQRYAEEHNEPAFAKAIGGVSFPDGEPIDVAVAGDNGIVAHGIELKTMVDNKANKITMKRDAMERKALWERKNKAPVHTVVIDDTKVFNANGPGQHDLSQRRIFYRRGYGSFRVGTMHEVKSVKELKTIMELPNDSLPPAAQRPNGQKLGRLAA